MRWISESTPLVLRVLFCLAVTAVLRQQPRLHQRREPVSKRGCACERTFHNSGSVTHERVVKLLVVCATSLESAQRDAASLKTFLTLSTSEVCARLSNRDFEFTHAYGAG